MIRRWLAAATVLALSALLLVGAPGRSVHAAGRAGYTYDSLRALLVTDSDLSSTGLSTVSDNQSSPTDGVLEVDRTFGKPVDGGAAIAVVSLFAGADGSSVPTVIQNLVLSGDLLKSAAGGVSGAITNFQLAGSQGIGDSDQSVTFNAPVGDTDYQWYGDTFVSGNLIGLVLYGAPNAQADSSHMDTILQAQDGKLP